MRGPSRSKLRLLLAAATLVVSACGKTAEAPARDHSGPGVGSAAATPPSEPWKLVRLAGALAVFERDDKVALVDAHAAIVSRPNISPAVFKEGSVTPTMLFWIEGASLHALDIATGVERWKSDLATEVERHQNTVLSRHYLARDDAVYVADDHGGIIAVGAATGKPLWRTSFGDVTNFNPRLVLSNKKLLVVNGDNGPFEEIDAATGKELSSGRGSFGAQGHFPFSIGRDPDGAPYEASGEDPAHRTVFALDRANRVLWSAKNWPVNGVGYDAHQDTVSSLLNGRGAIVLTSGNLPRVLVGFDSATGAFGFIRALTDRDQFAGLTATCAFVLELGHTHALECLDPVAGTTRWKRDLFGKDALAWPLTGGDVIVEDSSPPVMSRVDSTGKTLWHTEVPDKDVRSSRWLVGDTLAAESGAAAYVVDLATGNLATVPQ